MVHKTKLHNKQLAINKAIELVYSGKYTKALNTIKKYFNPTDAYTYFFKGWISQLTNNHVNAIRYFEKSLTKNPINEDVLIGLSGSYLELGDFERAHECAEQAILLDKDNPKNILTLATITSKRYRNDVSKQQQAIDLYSKAFDLVKDIATMDQEYIKLTTDILSGWGACLINMHDPQQAIMILEVAEHLDSLNPLVHKNLASAYTSINEIDKAIDSAKKAQRSDDNTLVYDSLYQEGMLELLKGNYRKGWRLHEFRLNTSQFSSIRSLKVPQWDGSPLQEGQSLLIYQEQGIGDTIQFSRYLPLVFERAKNIDIEVMANHYKDWKDPTEEPNSIKHFLHNNYKEYINNSFIKGWDKVDYTSYDYIISFMSLPRLFKTTLANIPDIPYFKPYDVSDAINRLDSFDVGILWQGSKEHRNDTNRSIPIEHVVNLINSNKDKKFVSLQLQNYPELDSLSNVVQIGNLIESIDDTLSVLKKCKVIITVDSMVAHLSASANIPTIILHAYSPDWRWMLDRRDSPWYPSVINYRQPAPKDWHSVFTDVDPYIKRLFNIEIKVD